MSRDQNKILILGAGKIGSLITCLLAKHDEYQVHLADIDLTSTRSFLNGIGVKVVLQEMDAQKEQDLIAYVKLNNIDSIISGLPYYCNTKVVQIAADHNLNYFDLTEDVEVTRYVSEVSQGKKTAFVPQCGLAPGFISIATHELMNHFDTVESVKMRVGALPVNPNNALKYSLTWSTDGLINEYGNLCYGIENGVMSTLMPLEGYETITIDGLQYEAFNTSGGLGSLAHTYADQVTTMNYKTMRYPGHCEKIKMLMNDLKLNDDRETLKRILENSIPKTKQDVVVIYVSVAGYRNNQLFEENYVKKIYPQRIANHDWSAIQVTTAGGICAAVDLVLSNPDQYQGLVKQEDFEFNAFINNRFGKYYSE